MGGLSRRAYIINQALHAGTKSFLVLDAGALLFDQPVLPSSQLAAKKEQAQGIMRAMQSMQYGAVGLASYDLAAGIEFVEQLQDAFKIPFVSSNLVRKENGERVFNPYITRQLGDTTVAVLGLTAVQPDSGKNGLLQDLAALPWQVALSNTLSEIGSTADMVILLSSFPRQVNREIARQFNEIHLILQAGSSTVNMPPELIENTLITQTASQGKYVGKIDINWTAAGKWPQGDFTKQIKTLKASLDRIDWKLDRLEKKDPLSNLEKNPQYLELQKNKTDILDELERITLQEQQAEKELSTYRDTLIALPISLPGDPVVQKIVNSTKQNIYNINKKRLAELRQQSARTELSASMAGRQSCRECHPVQAEQWQKTKHAKAWETLAAKNQQFNQDCLICHVTLPTYNKAEVLRDNLIATLTPEFYGVSCESCHGPGSKHVEAPESNKLTRPTAELCTSCHTPDQDDNFDFERKVKILACPTAEKQ